MRRLVLLIAFVSLIGCGVNLHKVCDKAQQGYMKANAAAIALKPTINQSVWNSCVVPLDHVANDAVVACYRAAASGSVYDMVKALADTAQLMVDDFSVLKGCKQ